MTVGHLSPIHVANAEHLRLPSATPGIRTTDDRWQFHVMDMPVRKEGIPDKMHSHNTQGSNEAGDNTKLGCVLDRQQLTTPPYRQKTAP